MPEQTPAPASTPTQDAMVTPPVSPSPVTPVNSPMPAAKSSKKWVIILVIILLLLCCCGSVLAGGYFLLKNGDITLNGACYKGIDNVFANKPVPCTPDNANSGGPNGQLLPNNAPPGTPDFNPGTTTPPSSASGTTVYANSELKLTYPTEWTVDEGTTDVTFSTPEGDKVIVSQSVQESGSLTSATCSDFADSFLGTFQSKVDLYAQLVGSTDMTTVGIYPACVFDIDTDATATTTHFRYVYIVNKGRGYLVTLHATDDSSDAEMAAMLNVVDSIELM